MVTTGYFMLLQFTIDYYRMLKGYCRIIIDNLGYYQLLPGWYRYWYWFFLTNYRRWFFKEYIFFLQLSIIQIYIFIKNQLSWTTSNSILHFWDVKLLYSVSNIDNSFCTIPYVIYLEIISLILYKWKHRWE